MLADDLRVGPWQEEEVAALIVQHHGLSVQDPVGVEDDVTGRSLPEDLGQGHVAEGFGLQKVLQDAARPHRGELVGVSDEDQVRARADRGEK